MSAERWKLKARGCQVCGFVQFLMASHEFGVGVCPHCKMCDWFDFGEVLIERVPEHLQTAKAPS